MIIKLTNTHPTFKGQPVLLNTDFFVSVHRGFATRGEGDSSALEEVTYIHCPPHGNWEVNETPEQIYDLIKQLK